MYKNLQKKICIISVIIILVYVLPIFSIKVYSADPASVDYGEWNDIPEDCGDEYTYMGWQKITLVGSEQMNLIEAAGRKRV